MIIQYRVEELSRLIQDISEITGISICVLDTQRNTLVRCSKEGDFCSLLQSLHGQEQLCKECDSRILTKCSQCKRLENHVCRAGLWDCAMPIMKHDALVGYIIMGRIRSANTGLPYFPDADAATLEQLHTLYQQIPVMSETQLHALYDLLPSVLFDNAIRVIHDPFINAVVEFIRCHLQETLSIRLLCDEFHVSANYLYRAFHSNFDCTVNAYITEQRLQKAKALLADTDDPVYMIAERVGLDNDTYFCKLFKKATGFTPTEYRKLF